MNSCNNRPKWALSPFEPIYCMSFGCPFEIASAGIKEGRQSCYKTTCLVDYSYMFFCISSVRQTAIEISYIQRDLITVIFYYQISLNPLKTQSLSQVSFPLLFPLRYIVPPVFTNSDKGKNKGKKII